jgi:predicted phosphodiesterase
MTSREEIVCAALKKYPNVPSMTLARGLYARFPQEFPTVNAARQSIRYRRGQNGKRMRERRKVKKELFKPEGSTSPFESLPVGLKEYDDWTPYNVEGNYVLVIADTHVPYHDKAALEIALEQGYKKGVDTILMLGDWFDFYSVSNWIKDPRRRNFAAEIQTSYEMLATIRDVFGDSMRIVAKVGNHEERLERYMKVKAPELLDVEVLKIDTLFNRGGRHDNTDLGITVVGDKRIVKIGNLNCIHGHEFGQTMFSPVNPARGLYLRGKETALCAHYHQTSEHSETTMTGDATVCWSVGCLSDMHPDYRPINKWNHGFALVRRDGNDFYVKNRKIIDGKVY